MSSFDSSFAPPPAPLIPSSSNFSAMHTNKPKFTKGTVTVPTIDTTPTSATLNASAGVITISTVDVVSSTPSKGVTISNSHVSGDSVVLLTINSYGGTVGTDGYPSVFATVPSAGGSFTLNVANEGVTVAALSGNLVVSFVVV